MWYSIELLDKTTAAKQCTAKGHRFAVFHIDATDDDPVGVVKPGFVDDEDDEQGDEQWVDG